MKIKLGRVKDEELSLKVQTLKRHMVCLGASGSGKTVSCKVVCEEMIRQGIPVIAIDPQGDIASLALALEAGEADQLGLDPKDVEEFREKAEVLIWTPASSVGIPLSVNPLSLLKSQNIPQYYEEFLREISLTADTLTSLLGYDLSKDEGRLTSGILNLTLMWITEQNIEVEDFTDLADFLSEAPEEFQERVQDIGSSRDLTTLAKKIRLLTVGKGKLLFELGNPVSIERLLGIDETATPGKTRLSVIYLNTLSSQEEKAFFISQIATSLYQWMLEHPSDDVQALFYIDEVAPFLPPVRKPACKDILKLLFKQARKYGVSCLIASQNPGDIDYTALSQCSTWNLGRLLTRQDIKKVEKIIKSMNASASEQVADSLPALEPGQFLLFAPDEFEEIKKIKIRWLMTKHSTLDEDEISALVPDQWRKALSPQPKKINKPLTARLKAASMARKEENPGEGEDSSPWDEPETSDFLVIVDEEELQLPQKILNLLEQEKCCLGAPEIGDRLGVSPPTVRKHASFLSQVKKAKVGRSQLYWHGKYAFLPQYGLTSLVEVAKLQMLEQRALEKAENQLDKKFFFIDTEKIDSISLVHLPLWQVYFTEALQSRYMVFFEKHFQKEENIYFHGNNGKICLYEKGEGFAFVETPKEKPSLLVDLDDMCTFESRFPGDLQVKKSYWKKLLPQNEVERKISQKFKIDVHRIALAFLPLWELEITEKKGAKKRTLYLDGVLGLPVQGM